MANLFANDLFWPWPAFTGCLLINDNNNNN